MLNILIAADHKPSRDALTEMLSSQSFCRVINVCADTYAAISIAGRELPDIILIDGTSDPLSAIAATKKIRQISNAGIIAMTRTADAGFAQHMIAAGALGYLTTNCSVAEIAKAINEVVKDNLYCCFDHMPVVTPPPSFSFKKSMASLRDNSKKKIAAVRESHWHAILRFTN